MDDRISIVWNGQLPDDCQNKLRDILEKVTGKHNTLQVFFRADDIGCADPTFHRLMHLFLAHETPLCLAVVPEWLDSRSWEAMQEFNPESPLWCWHQHGRRHLNHEKEGKKCEFGASRSREAIGRDLVDGRNMLADRLGNLFYPIFTPPWNRCGLTTLQLLREHGFRGVSRSKGASPPADGILPDFQVNVDLHTRRETHYTLGWQNLLTELAIAADSGLLGFMLHHQRMNESAFAFLTLLLNELERNENISRCTFRNLSLA